MKYLSHSIVVIFICLFASHSYAVKIFECVDEAGNKSFESRCPPGTSPVNEKDFYTGADDEEAIPDVEISLYSVPTCEACDVVRNILDKYGVKYSEKNVKTNIELQNELQKISGAEGTLSVPTVTIGEKVIVGYNKAELTKTLEEVGYGKNSGSSESNTSEEQQVEQEEQPPAETETAG